MIEKSIFLSVLPCKFWFPTPLRLFARLTESSPHFLLKKPSVVLVWEYCHKDRRNSEWFCCLSSSLQHIALLPSPAFVLFCQWQVRSQGKDLLHERHLSLEKPLRVSLARQEDDFQLRVHVFEVLLVRSHSSQLMRLRTKQDYHHTRKFKLQQKGLIIFVFGDFKYKS